MEVLGIVAVSPQHVRLHEVREDEAGLELLQELLGGSYAFDVRLRRVLGIDVEMGEDVRDLPHAVHLGPGFTDLGQVVGPLRLEREVVAIRRSLIVAGPADERPRDDTTDRVLAGGDLAGVATAWVGLLARDWRL